MNRRMFLTTAGAVASAMCFWRPKKQKATSIKLIFTNGKTFVGEAYPSPDDGLPGFKNVKINISGYWA
jgi:hypothetical protein